MNWEKIGFPSSSVYCTCSGPVKLLLSLFQHTCQAMHAGMPALILVDCNNNWCIIFGPRRAIWRLHTGHVPCHTRISTPPQHHLASQFPFIGMYIYSIILVYICIYKLIHTCNCTDPSYRMIEYAWTIRYKAELMFETVDCKHTHIQSV